MLQDTWNISKVQKPAWPTKDIDSILVWFVAWMACKSDSELSTSTWLGEAGKSLISYATCSFHYTHLVEVLHSSLFMFFFVLFSVSMFPVSHQHRIWWKCIIFCGNDPRFMSAQLWIAFGEVTAAMDCLRNCFLDSTQCCLFDYCISITMIFLYSYMWSLLDRHVITSSCSRKKLWSTKYHF